MNTYQYQIAALHNRINDLEQALVKVGSMTRNPVGTLSAVLTAVALNIGIGWAHIQYNIPAYRYLLEQEQVLATDLGVWLREIADYDTSRFVSMPSGVVMIGLTPAQTQQYIQTVILTESGGKQHIINAYGYCGIGQFGASALVAVGLVSASKFRAGIRTGILRGRDGYIGQKQWLKDSTNWLIDGGLQAFLDNKHLQIKAMIELANLNIREGYRRGALHDSDGPHKHAGFAKSAHLVGAGSAARWYKYRIDSYDGNGTRASKYARDGERVIQQQGNI